MPSLMDFVQDKSKRRSPALNIHVIRLLGRETFSRAPKQKKKIGKSTTDRELLPL
jgi:hypothetical protein